MIGLIWADEPEDRLLPSPEKLQALRIFANQAAAAIISAAHRREMRFLADHDPLTRLLNRRAFVERLDAEVARGDPLPAVSSASCSATSTASSC